MKVLRLFIPGRFEDVQLYMGHLVAFTEDRDVRLLELEPFATRLGEQYAEWQGIAVLAFARNDWLSTSQFKTMAATPGVSDALRTNLAKLSRFPLVVEPPAIEPLHGLRLRANVLLDTLFYGTRLYVGTDAGFYHVDIDWQEKEAREMRKRIDARCVSVSAEYGTVNASCEEDGLFSGYDEFGWRSRGQRNGSLDRTAARSLRTSWLRHDLVNYESTAHAELLRSLVERVEPEGEPRPRRREVVTRLGVERIDLDFLVERLKADEGIEVDEIQFIWNSSTSFFVNTFSRGFYTLVLQETAHTVPSWRVHVRRYSDVPERVVAVHTTAAGWIVETDFRLFLFAAGVLTPLLGEEPLSVRTFAGSKRYRHLIAATVEEGVHLLSLIDDERL